MENKKKRVAFIIPCIIACMAIFVYCKKPGKISPAAEEPNSGVTSLENGRQSKKIPFKDYGLTGKKLVNTLKSFEDRMVNIKQKPTELSSSDSLSIDSAQYLVEGSLNFTYGKVREICKESFISRYKYEFNFDSESLNMSTNSLESIYSELAAKLDSITGQDSTVITAVDFQANAYIPDEGAGYFEATVYSAKVSQFSECETPAFKNNQSYRSFSRQILYAFYPFNTCTTATSNNEPDRSFTIQMRCVPELVDCNLHWYFPVTIHQYAPTSGSDLNSYWVTNNMGSICSSFSSPSILNTYFSYAKALVGGSGGLGESVNWDSFTSTTVVYVYNSTPTYCAYWRYDWITGVKQCEFID